MIQALDTLGSTKWRVNKRVLGVIDRIWASGGHLADLVDREDVGISAVNCNFFFSPICGLSFCLDARENLKKQKNTP